MPRSITTDEMLECVRAWAETHYTTRLPKRLRLYFVSEDPEDFVALPMPSRAVVVLAPPIEDEEEESGAPFKPDELQQQILDALAGKALVGDALAAAVDCDRRNLYRFGLAELREQGLVKNRRPVGYYRPDDPPEDLPDE